MSTSETPPLFLLPPASCPHRHCGLKLEQAYWTVGPYGMVTIFEAPDDEALSAHLLEIASLGNVRTTTLRAYDEQGMSVILQRLP